MANDGKQYDYIIIGAGTSGGLIAGKLQEAGASCLLLEAGKRFNRETFPRNETKYTAEMFWGGGVDLEATGRIAFVRAKCVGGGSVVNQALMDRFDDIALDSWRDASGISDFSSDGMAQWYDRAEAGLSLQEIEDRHRNRNARIFAEGLDRHGLGYHALRRGQTDCALDEGMDCMSCLGGCKRDSKQSTLITYIPKGEARGLEVLSEVHVETIEHRPDGVMVKARRGGKDELYRGAKAVLACGALGTSHLLLRSGFKSKLPALGTRFTAHPQHMCYGVFDEPIDAHKGAFQAYGSDDPKFRDWRFKFENVFAPPGTTAMIAPLQGPALMKYMKQYRHLACIETCVRAETEGEMRINNKGVLKIDYRLIDADRKRSEQGVSMLTDMLKSSGAKEVIVTWMQYCLHLMGGCVMGTDPKRSVVNEQFSVHDHPHFLVADGSVFPNAPGINPALTIMALSHKLVAAETA